MKNDLDIAKIESGVQPDETWIPASLCLPENNGLYETVLITGEIIKKATYSRNMFEFNSWKYGTEFQKVAFWRELDK